MSGVTYSKTWSNGETLTHTDLNANFTAVNTAVGAASGLASLNSSSLVVEDPANATATKAAGKICKWGTSEAFQCSALTATTISGSTITGSGVVQGTQLTSTIADGTAPLIVTSTTEVANLKAATATTATTANELSFEAHRGSTQTVSSDTPTRIAFDTETFDTNNNYDNATNYRFTPTVAGKYLLSIHVDGGVAGGGTITQGNFWIRKNGIDVFSIPLSAVTTSAGVSGGASIVVSANGSTDYFDIYGQLTQSGGTTLSFTTNSYFSGCRVGA